MVRRNTTPTRTTVKGHNEERIGIVDRIRSRHPVPNPYRVGDVCTLIAKGNPELKERAGQWCIVEEVHNFSCTVKTWNGSLQVKIENLRELSYSPRHREEIGRLRERLYRLSTGRIDDTVMSLLASLGRIDRPFLTPVEERLLEVLEKN